MKAHVLPNEPITLNVPVGILNEAYEPFFETIDGVEVYYGGENAGKSRFVALKKIMQLTILPGRNMVCLRKQKTNCFDSCWGLILWAMKRQRLDKYWEIRRSEYKLRNIVNGNQIVFDGMDDVENIKSIMFESGNMTDVWYEEASEEDSAENMRTIRGRLRDEFLRTSLILTFNPVSRDHWLFNYVTKELNGAAILDIDPKKDMPRHIHTKVVYDDPALGRIETTVLIMKTTWRDNKFSKKEDIATTELLRFSDPYRYMVYSLAEWGTSGITVFNANKIQAQAQELKAKYEKEPPCKIEFAYELEPNGIPKPESFKHFKSDTGQITIYKWPVARRPYVLAFDTKGEGIDWYAGHVLDNITEEQVAVFHSQDDPEYCILQLFGLGVMYNNALICPEINFDGAYSVKKLKELKYKNIYQRNKPVDSYYDGQEQRLGFRTHVGNRSQMLMDLKTWTNTHMHCIMDLATLNEMLTFTQQFKNSKGFWAAEKGSHDDLIMALAIVLQIREQQTSEETLEIGEIKGYYYPEQIESMVSEKKISYAEAERYKKTSEFFKKFAPKLKRSSRYDR
jgi:phage terminase large subunit